jgi:hypothetical protein
VALRTELKANARPVGLGRIGGDLEDGARFRCAWSYRPVYADERAQRMQVERKGSLQVLTERTSSHAGADAAGARRSDEELQTMKPGVPGQLLAVGRGQGG